MDTSSEPLQRLQAELDEARQRISTLERQLAMQSMPSGQMAEALRTSEELYRSLIESSDDAISLIDFSGRYLYLNLVAAKPFGQPPDRLVGKTIADLFASSSPSSEQSSQILKRVQAVIQTAHGVVYDSEVTLTGQNKRWYRVSIQPVRDSSGKPYAALVNASDITDKKVAEQATIRQNEILRQSRNLIALCGLDRAVSYMNQGGSDLIGLSDPQEAVGRRISDFYAEEDLIHLRNDYLPQVFQTGQWHGENRLKTASGRLIDVDQVIFSIRDSSGAVIELATIMFDISERKAAEEALRQNENYLRSLVDSQTAFNIRVDQTGHLSYCNQRYSNQFGWLAPSLIGMSALNAIYPDDRDEVMISIRQCMTQVGIPIQAEVRSAARDGGYNWIHWELIAVQNSDEAFIEIQCVGFDITQQKQAEAELIALNQLLEQRVVDRTTELENSQKRLEAIFNHSGDGILLLDVEHGIQQANHVFMTQFGPLPDSYVGMALSTFFDPHDAITIENSIQEILISHATRRLNVRGKNGHDSFFDAEISLSPVGRSQQQVTSLVAVIRDVTMRRNTEKALQDKLLEEQTLQKYLQALNEVAIDLTQINGLDQFYEQVVTMGIERLGFDRIALFRYDPERHMVLGTYGTDQYGHSKAEHAVQFELDPNGNMLKSLKKPGRYHLLEKSPLVYERTVVGEGWHVTVPLRHGDQPLGWLVADNLINQKPVSLLQLEILGQYGVYIAASLVRRQVESTLQQTKDQLQAILDHSTASIFMKDLNGHWLLFNRMASADLSIVDKPHSASPESTLAAAYYYENDQQVSTSGTPIGYEATVADHTYWVTKFPIFDDHDQIYAIGGIATDITTRKRYEESLERALQHEKELGELKSRFISMASHEFRVPLSVILSAADTLSAYRDRLDDNQIEARLEKIRQQVEHLKGIMEDVLQLTHNQTRNFKPLRGNLDALCRDILEEFRTQTEKSARINYQCANAPLMLNFDNRLMRQLISNLVANALKYSPGDTPIAITLKLTDNAVILTVSDQGIGIPPDDLPLLFEPFHRAGNVGEISGTGLGLSITKQAVETHGGVITVESQVDVGTTFTARFPFVTEIFPTQS